MTSISNSKQKATEYFTKTTSARNISTEVPAPIGAPDPDVALRVGTVRDK